MIEAPRKYKAHSILASKVTEYHFYSVLFEMADIKTHSDSKNGDGLHILMGMGQRYLQAEFKIQSSR